MKDFQIRPKFSMLLSTFKGGERLKKNALLCGIILTLSSIFNLLQNPVEGGQDGERKVQISLKFKMLVKIKAEIGLNPALTKTTGLLLPELKISRRL